MSFKIDIPFYAFKLNLLTGGSVMTSMTDSQVVRMGQAVHHIANQYAQSLQEKVINTGDLLQLLEEFRQGEFYKDSLTVSFPKAKDGISFPAFELAFDCFFNPGERGIWGIVPALGIEAFAVDEANLFKQLQEAIRQDFVRKKKLTVVQDIVSAIWYDSVELHQHEISLSMPTPRELEKMDQGAHEKWLPKVARPLRLTQGVMYGREEELKQFVQALEGRFSRNILLVGPNGVGKTAMVWEMAYRMHTLSENNKEEGKQKKEWPLIWETTASTLIKELSGDTGWQDNLSFLCRELSLGNDLLFVRNLMDLFEVGKYQGNQVSLAEYLQPFISRGEISIISECTEEEVAAIEIRRPNYLSFFQLIRLEEPKKEMEWIITRKVQDIAQDRQVRIEAEAIRETIRLQRRFTPYAGLPGKPIRFLESILISESNQQDKENGAARIDREKVIRHFCQDSGMPDFVVDPSIPMDVKKIRDHFNRNVFGQKNAVDSVVDLLASVKTALTRTEKPIASFLFVGPTGVGKTELAKVLAEFMFGSRDRLIRFDMSEFASFYDVERLMGATYFSEGLLTSAVRKAPFSVLLFDEIEKAHQSFYDLLLQVLSEGRLSDSQGKLVNFCSTIIIMTSNIGAARIQGGTIGWRKETAIAAVVESYLTAVRAYFNPELFNRIDEVIPFLPLDAAIVRSVIEREMALFRQREGLKYRRVDLQIQDEVLDYLAATGYDTRYGARQLQRTIREELIIPLARKLNQEDFEDQLLVVVILEDGKINMLVSPDPLGLELLLEELEKTNYADHASALRREIYALKESHTYVKLLSELDQMERLKVKKKNKFWEKGERVAKYTGLIEVQEEMSRMIRQIEKFESDLSLACLQLQPYSPALTEQILEWQEAFVNLKIDLYSQLNPGAGKCKFGIYGSEPAPLIRLYLELFQSKNFAVSAQSIWFRERYYNEEIEVKKEGLIRREKRAAYISHPYYPYEDIALLPPRPGDVCYGVEFLVEGTAALLYLQAEDGFQRWDTDDHDSPQDYRVQVGDKNTLTPPKIHRQDFYKRQNIRRVITPTQIRDTLLKINREYNKGELAMLIREELDRLFDLVLEELMT